MSIESYFNEIGDPRNYEDKKIGDKVEITDIPFLFYYLEYETKKPVLKETSITLLKKAEDLIENHAVIIEENLNIKFNCGHCDMEHVHDCAIYYPHNKKKYYTSKDNLRLINK